MSTPIHPADLALLTAQLGRFPRGARHVERRCPEGHPLVIRTDPLVEGRPFPTLFWLTCPALHARLARLEAAGWIRRLEEELQGDSRFRRAYERDHERYAAERWKRLSAGARRHALSRGFAAVLRERGIGGIFHRHRIKCLHLQVAHHLARGSALGRRLQELHGLALCEPGPAARAPVLTEGTGLS